MSVFFSVLREPSLLHKLYSSSLSVLGDIKLNLLTAPHYCFQPGGPSFPVPLLCGKAGPYPAVEQAEGLPSHLSPGLAHPTSPILSQEPQCPDLLH